MLGIQIFRRPLDRAKRRDSDAAISGQLEIFDHQFAAQRKVDFKGAVNYETLTGPRACSACLRKEIYRFSWRGVGCLAKEGHGPLCGAYIWQASSFGNHLWSS